MVLKFIQPPEWVLMNKAMLFMMRELTLGNHPETPSQENQLNLPQVEHQEPPGSGKMSPPFIRPSGGLRI